MSSDTGGGGGTGGSGGTGGGGDPLITGNGRGGAGTTAPVRDSDSPQSETAKEASCDIYKLAGDVVQMKRLGCPDTPEGGPKQLHTIPTGSERGSEVDEEISMVLNYIMLSLLLLLALIVMIICCCQVYSRIAIRRAAMREHAVARRSTQGSKSRSVYSGRGGGCGSCGGVGCGGGTGGYGSSYSYRSNTSYKGGSRLGAECHDCGYLNMV